MIIWHADQYSPNLYAVVYVGKAFSLLIHRTSCNSYLTPAGATIFEIQMPLRPSYQEQTLFKFLRIKTERQGHLGGSAGWASDS